MTDPQETEPTEASAESEEELPSDVMTVRELAGAIRRADAIFVWVPCVPGDGVWLPVRRGEARALVDYAREQDIAELYAEEDEDSGELRIGREDIVDADEPAEPAEPAEPEPD